MKSIPDNDMTAKPASLKPAPVPKADTVPPATREGIKSISKGE